jgi:SSS family solute:Na+ symporter
LLGLALTALLASFMSGMAGNVTAFNTVWTYDLYQAYIAKNKSDQHYFWMGQFITVVGILLSIACAYFARNYNNAMDIIQLVFGFVNAPLLPHSCSACSGRAPRARARFSDYSAASAPRPYSTL